MPRFYKSISLLLLIFSQLSCSNEQIAKNIEDNGEGPGNEKERSEEKDIKKYAEVITEEAESDSGVFLVHKVSEKYIMKFPIRC